MSPHPATPPANPLPHPQALWPSPQFSDYFSDAGDPTSPANADQRKANNPIQARIIGRLEAIARKVASQDHGTQTPHLMDFDTELSSLESRLNAPDSQTREIAEDTNSGLFSDDDEDPAVLQAENEGLRRQVQEGHDVIDRISRLRESLQRQFDEMKKTNQLATDRFDAAGKEITGLKGENEHLRTENESLRGHNQQLHDDLRTAIPTISRLRAQLDAIEQQSLAHMDDAARDELQEEIGQLKHEWHDVERDFEDIGRRYRKPTSRSDSAIGNASPPPSSDGRSDSPEMGHRSRIIIRRGGFIRRIDADPSSSEETDGEAVDGYEQIVGEEETSQANGHISKDADHAEDDEQVVRVPAGNDSDAVEESSDEETPTKTPWQELWDSLAEYAGMHNHYEE